MRTQTREGSADNADLVSAREIRGGARNPWPRLAFRFWHGMCLRPLFRMFSEQRWRIRNWPMAGTACATATVNSIMSVAQKVGYSKRISSQRIVEPVFVVGHWRTGTTLLQEYLSLDRRFRAPTTVECCCPDHFLITDWFIRHFLKCPSKRPMDEMSAGWDTPQEDEFGLMVKGLPSLYRHIGFPEDEPACLDSLNFEGCTVQEIDEWGEAYRQFLQALLARSEARLLLKSPTHTGRIAHLQRLFPDAKFIHIARSPREFIPSTLHLWRELIANVALQRSKPRELSFVMDCYRRMYDGYFSGVDRVEDGSLVEIRYEDLVKEPSRTLAKVYDALQFGAFDEVKEKVVEEAGRRSDYRRNRLEFTSAMQAAQEEYCGAYCQRFGY